MASYNWPAEGGSGAGDIVGPNSSTDNAVARFSGASGKILKNSGVIVDNSNNVSGIGTLNATGNITNDALTASRVLTSNGSKVIESSSVTTTTLGFLDATSSIQTQLNAKEPTITGAATTIVSANLTVDRVTTSNGSGKIAASTVTTTTLGFLDATSSIQTQLNAKEPTVNLTASRAVVSSGGGALAAATTTATEIGFVNGVTSSIQTQLNSKQATITGAATTITSSDLTVSRALTSDGSGKVAVSTTTATELGYVSGVTSSIQTQITQALTAKAALMCKTSTQNPGTTAATKTTWDSVSSAEQCFDPFGICDLTNERLVCPDVGKYSLIISLAIGAFDASSTLQVFVYKNGSPYFRYDVIEGGTSNTRQFFAAPIISVGTIGDYFEIYTSSAADNSYTITGSSGDGQNKSFFGLVYLGA